MTTKRGGPRIAGPGKRIGRPRKAIEEKVPDDRGLITIRIDPARQAVIDADLKTQTLAQRLMLYNWPGVNTVQQLYAYALRKLAEQTDD